MTEPPITATDRNVYILGAGFSADAGAPLIQGFLDFSRRLLDHPFSDLDPVERAHFKNVFKFRREMAQSREKVRMDLDDIEQLFGLVEISQRLESRPPETRDSTVYLIAKTLQLAVNSGFSKRHRFSLPTKSDLSPQVPWERLEAIAPDALEKQQTSIWWYRGVDEYVYFAVLVCSLFDDQEKRKWRKDTIITFNYDLVCDHALRRLGYEADYHLDAALVDDRREPQTGGRRDLLKLHGSTNWGVCSACNERAVILSEKVTDSPGNFRQMKCRCGQSAFHPFLIPPSWDKSEYRKVIAPVWKKAVDELKSATRICIIGYSMPETDAFFKYLLTMALSQNHGLYKLIVVDYQNPRAAHDLSPIQPPQRRSEIEIRYRRLLDPLFRRRTFYFSNEGLFGFLTGNRSRRELDRGDLLIDTQFAY